MLILISPSISNWYFHMTKIIFTRNVQTVCSIKPKLWWRSQVLGLGFWPWVFDPQLHVVVSGSCILSLACLVLVPDFLVPGPMSQIPGHGSRSIQYFLQSVTIFTKFDRKISQPHNVKKCDRYQKIWQKVIWKCDRYCKVWQEVITKWSSRFRGWGWQRWLVMPSFLRKLKRTENWKCPFQW